MKKVEIYLPRDLVERLKDFLLTKENGSFAANTVSPYFEGLLREALEEKFSNRHLDRLEAEMTGGT